MSLKKKRKDYNHKEFAIGSKIEYNSKLYEVVKSNTCENCSISSFCSASDNYVPSLLIPRDKLLNTRRGFRTIYYLMRLSQHDMTTVIKDIIAIRHAGINFILNVCDKLEKENDCMLTSLRGG